jgi:hypothetical protein
MFPVSLLVLSDSFANRHTRSNPVTKGKIQMIQA